MSLCSLAHKHACFSLGLGLWGALLFTFPQLRPWGLHIHMHHQRLAFTHQMWLAIHKYLASERIASGYIAELQSGQTSCQLFVQSLMFGSPCATACCPKNEMGLEQKEGWFWAHWEILYTADGHILLFRRRDEERFQHPFMHSLFHSFLHQPHCLQGMFCKKFLKKTNRTTMVHCSRSIGKRLGFILLKLINMPYKQNRDWTCDKLFLLGASMLLKRHVKFNG